MIRFDKEFRLRKKIALLDAEKSLLLCCSTEVMLKAYVWYIKKKCFLAVLKSITLLVLVFISPTAAFEFIKSQWGG